MIGTHILNQMSHMRRTGRECQNPVLCEKAEANYQGSTKTLFVCVAQLVRAGVSFSSEEQESIRALAQRSD